MPSYGPDERALFEDDATKLYEEICQTGGIPSTDDRITEGGDLRSAFDLLVEMGLLLFDSEQDRWSPEDPTSVQSRVVSPLSQEAAKLLSESSQWASAFSSLAQSWRRAPQSSGRGPFTYLRSVELINSVLDQLLAECEEEMLTAQPEGGRNPRSLARAALRDIELLERGAVMRTLYQHSARRSSVTHKYVAAVTSRGAEVRTLDEFFNRMIVIDRRLAIVPGRDANMAIAVNAVQGSTGVSATVSGGNLALHSQEYGASQFVSLTTISGTFAATVAKDFGRDAAITIDGAAAQVDGLSASYRSANLDIELSIDSSFNAVGNDSFYITGGGAVFAMGSKVTENDKASIGIQSVTTGSLGNSAVGFLSTLGSGQANSLSSGNMVAAQKILDKATEQVSQLRGRLGAFERFTIGSTINALGVALENVSAADSAIRDTDFAAETANLTRAQILSQASATVLAQANANPQLALTLLRGQ